MEALMTIGDFSRAVRLSAKALRFYHQTGVLIPALVDGQSGYRLYAPEQIPDAQIVRTLRGLDVSVDSIRAVLATSSVDARAELMADHLTQMETRLEATRAAVVSLRAILEPPRTPIGISYRSVPETTVAAVQSDIALRDLGGWFRDSVATLSAVARRADPASIGPFGGMWSDELFAEEFGPATLFLTTAPGFDERAVRDDATILVLPPVELAVAVHDGGDEAVPRVYAALGEHVARHEISVHAPVREIYISGFPSIDERAVTEIGWPIFRVSR